MSDNGRNPDPLERAFEDEMAEWELERELSGFAAEMRGALLKAPDHATTERHLRAMLAAGETTSELAPAAAPVSIARRPRLMALRIAAVAGAGLVLLSGGLAIAGVRPPEPISDALESLGIDVPGSDADSSADEAAKPTKPRGEGDGGGSSAPTPASDGAKPGRGVAKGNDAPGARRAAERSHGQRGDEASAEGQETAAEASSGGAPPTSPGASDATPPQDPGAASNQETPPVDAQGQGRPSHSLEPGPPASAPGATQSQAAQEAHGPG
jgi:hypothetical protein